MTHRKQIMPDEQRMAEGLRAKDLHDAIFQRLTTASRQSNRITLEKFKRI